MTTPSPLQHPPIYTEYAKIASTLGNVHRIVLLDHIAQGERAVERLAALSGLSIANTSQHLQHLKRAGLVDTRRDGKRVFYRLMQGPVLNLLDALRQIAAHNHPDTHYLTTKRSKSQANLELISQRELLKRIKENTVTLLDVRTEEDFKLGHLPGAINIPIGELGKHLADLPSDIEIVAYCRGPHCVFSHQAMEYLNASGFTARCFATGFPGWKAAGLTIEMQTIP